MKNNITLSFNKLETDFLITCNFGWSIRVENSQPVLTFSGEQLWEITPTNFPNVLSSAPNVYVSDNTYFSGDIFFNFEQTSYDASTFTDVANTLLNLSAGISSPMSCIVLREITNGNETIELSISRPTENSKKFNSLTINTGYNTDEHYGVICKLYNKVTNELIETKPQSQDTQVTFDNLVEKTDYVVIVTYVCNENNSNYNYDNFVEITTINKTIMVYGNNKGVFQEGELYASPNQDGIFKEVTAFYYKDENNNWKKME